MIISCASFATPPAWYTCLNRQNSADRKRGQRKGGHVKNRQKVSKTSFRHFSSFVAQGKKHQKSSTIFSTFFDNFARAPVFRRILGGSEKCPKSALRRVRKVCLCFRSESPKTVSCAVRSPVLGCFPRCETGFCTVRETLSGPSAQRHQITFSTVLKLRWPDSRESFRGSRTEPL